MKTRWIVSLVLVFALFAGILSVHERNGQTALAQDAAPNKPAPDAASGKPVQKPQSGSGHYGAHTCPVIPIEVYGGASLYEAQHYETDDCNPPTLSYVYGTFTYPQTCPTCLPYKHEDEEEDKDKAVQSFYGLAMPVPADYEHTMPAGKPRKYSKKALTPDRIRYLYLDEKDVYVRVFSIDVNRTDMATGAEPDDIDFKEKFHFAFECSDPATIGVNVAEIEVIHESKQRPVPDPGKAPTTVYDVTYDYAGGQAHILTFLCGDPEPPEDQQIPVAANQ